MLKAITLLSAVVLLVAVSAQAQQRPVTIDEVAISTQLGNLQNTLGQILDRYKAQTAEADFLKKQLADALEKCGDPCKPKPEAEKK